MPSLLSGQVESQMIVDFVYRSVKRELLVETACRRAHCPKSYSVTQVVYVACLNKHLDVNGVVFTWSRAGLIRVDLLCLYRLPRAGGLWPGQ